MPHLLLKNLPRYECLLDASKDFPELDPTAVEALLNLLLTADDVFAVLEKSFTERSISHGRFGVLMLLWRSSQPRAAKLMGVESCAGGPRTPAELAEAAGVTRATMTGLIDTLERDGLVKREADRDDRRMMSVRLTARGEKFLVDFLPGYFRSVATLMSPLSEPERRTLVQLLSKVQRHTVALSAGAEPVATSAG